MLTPLIYYVSTLQVVSIAFMDGWNNSNWSWGEFRIPQFWLGNAVVAAYILQLRQLLNIVLPCPNSINVVSWKPETNGEFLVRSSKRLYEKICIFLGHAEEFDANFKEVWRMEAPLKVKSLGWKFFINKLLTRDLLILRGIINRSSASSCIYYGVKDETSTHSLLLCHNSGLVWKDIADWIGLRDYMQEVLRRVS